MRNKASLLAVFLSCAAPAAAEDPLSAIDWLDSVSALQQPTVAPKRTPSKPEPPVANSGSTPDVESLPLDAPTHEAVGLLPMSATGLPPSLWSSSTAATLVPLLQRVEPAVPAMSALLFTLLLAEADPPLRGSDGPSMLLARLDRLLSEGAVDPGLALIERAGGGDAPELFSRWMDFALLAGSEEAPCRVLTNQPTLSRDMGTRIFCAARSGDWSRGVTLLGTAQALGLVDEHEAELLARFLDPALVEDAAPLRPPARPTPLEFKLFEAMGEALPTRPLPRQFAATDIGGTSGWRAQIEAAERLATRGALSDNRLLGIYSDRKPAASGGVWDRVAAIQAFEAALDGGRADLIGPALVRVWPQMRISGLIVPFSRLFGARLVEVGLTGRAGDLAQRAALLSTEYETAAQGMTPTSALMKTVTAIAGGTAPTPLPEDARLAAAAAAWDSAKMPGALSAMLDRGRLGEVILRAMMLFGSGAEGNQDDLVAGLAALRGVGLEDTARRAAIQYLILADEGALR